MSVDRSKREMAIIGLWPLILAVGMAFGAGEFGWFVAGSALLVLLSPLNPDVKNVFRASVAFRYLLLATFLFGIPAVHLFNVGVISTVAYMVGVVVLAVRTGRIWFAYF